MNVTPGLLEVALHYHTTPGDHPLLGEGCYVVECAEELLAEGMLALRPRPDGKGPYYEATERLRVWIDQGLCRVPFPEQRWVIP